VLSLQNFPWMLEPLPRRASGCLYPLLPLTHRPSPSPQKIGFPHFPVKRTSQREVISRLQLFDNLQASKFAATQAVPTAVHRLRHTGQLWRLHPSRTYVVTFACIGYASRPNRAIDDKGLTPSSFAALPAAPRTFTSQDRQPYRLLRSMAGLHVPLSTLRDVPYGASSRMTWGQCGSLHLHRSGLAPPTPCRSPGAPVQKLRLTCFSVNREVDERDFSSQ
jgi:hypothetical protein